MRSLERWFNPAKHGLVGAVPDWPLSSFHRDVWCGLVPGDWAKARPGPHSASKAREGRWMRLLVG